MLTVPDRAGPARPLASSPPRNEGSVRRTTSIDSSRPGGITGEIVVDARSRDLRTGRRPSRIWTTEQHLTATIGIDRTLVAVEAEPAEPRLSQLLGTMVGPGFRARMTAVLADHAERRTLLHTLLDDLPGATLVSGYAMQRAQPPVIPEGSPADGAFAQHVMASEDMCSGWAADATIMVTFRTKGSVPTPMGPEAPVLERAGDELSWHDMAPLAEEATRRRRRLDLVQPSGDRPNWSFDSHFRDSYRDAHGVETAIHEYVVEGWLADSGRQIGGVRVEPRVLPWVECPAAVDSGTRLPGMPLTELRSKVRAEFTGTTTCTHLNDSFRVLADLIPLLAQAADPDGAYVQR